MCRFALAQLIPLPLTVSCFSKIQIGFTFLVPAHLGSPGQRAVKRVCVCGLYDCTVCRFTVGSQRISATILLTMQPTSSRKKQRRHLVEIPTRITSAWRVKERSVAWLRVRFDRYIHSECRFGFTDNSDGLDSWTWSSVTSLLFVYVDDVGLLK